MFLILLSSSFFNVHLYLYFLFSFLFYSLPTYFITISSAFASFCIFPFILFIFIYPYNFSLFISFFSYLYFYYYFFFPLSFSFSSTCYFPSSSVPSTLFFPSFCYCTILFLYCYFYPSLPRFLLSLSLSPSWLYLFVPCILLFLQPSQYADPYSCAFGGWIGRVRLHAYIHTHAALEFTVCGSGGHMRQVSISESSLVCHVLFATNSTPFHVCRNLISGK
jgi:hypothetical protein